MKCTTVTAYSYPLKDPLLLGLVGIRKIRSIRNQLSRLLLRGPFGSLPEDLIKSNYQQAHGHTELTRECQI